MRRPATTRTRSRDVLARAGRLALLAPALAGGSALLAPWAAGAPAPGPPGKQTSFTGRIVSATGHFADLRGAVALALHASAPQDPAGASPLAVHHYSFTLSVAAPPCSGKRVRLPHRCVSPRGRLAGSALEIQRNPDGPKQAEMTGLGRVAPLGAVKATGSAVGLGFIASGRFQLKLVLVNAAGSITIAAQSKRAAGFTAPF